jgi:hypothetical protein
LGRLRKGARHDGRNDRHRAFSSEEANLNIPLPSGAMIATLRLPTVFVMEGGYALGEISENVLNVPTGFLA